MKKDDKVLLVVIMVMLLIAFPALFFLALIGYAIYINYNKKYNIKEKVTKFGDKYVKNNKSKDYEVIDTSAEVISSTVIQEDEWKATKEYKR